MELDFNRDWLLMKEDGSSCHVNLPHDAMIHEQRSFSNRNGDKTGFFPGGKYVYKKEFSLDSRSSDEQIIIHFNGVYGRTKLMAEGVKPLYFEYRGRGKADFLEFILTGRES